ncbi:MAG: hypothetical protein AAF519_00790 [Bacteroidota bacterium]
MKTISKILSVVVLSILVFASCESIDNPAPINSIDTTRTATISGVLRANLDVRNDTLGFSGNEVQLENAPAGTKVFVEVDSRDYATSTTGGNYQQLIFETTVGANGEFEIQIPALSTFISANLRGEEFVTDKTIDDQETQRSVYRSAEGDVDFIENSTFFVILIYSDSSFE